jgi:hypothetical protein
MSRAAHPSVVRLDVLLPLLGVWLMLAPAVLGFDGAARVDALVVGPLLAAAGIIALSAITRAVRRLALPLGAWLVAAPVWMPHGSVAATDSVIVGVVAAALAFVRVPTDERFGGGWRALWDATDVRRADARAER